MARRQTIEVKCDRCKRIEYVNAKSGKSVEADLDIKFRESGTGKKTAVKFDDLCSPCEKTVKNLIDSIVKEIKGKSPDRKSDAKKEGGNSPSIKVESTQPSSASAS